MPVRSTLHSSEVSTSDSKYVFGTTRLGSAEPTELIRACRSITPAPSRRDGYPRAWAWDQAKPGAGRPEPAHRLEPGCPQPWRRSATALRRTTNLVRSPRPVV